MRRAFTLIELLAIVAIIGIMVTASVVNVRAGQGAARIRAATRDIFATVRHARSVALVTQQPSVITYSTERADDEVCAKVEINSAKIFGADTVKSATTLEGVRVSLVDEVQEDGADASGGEGLSAEDVLFAPITQDVVRGVRIKVLKEGEELDYSPDEAKARPKISVFSNVDYLIGRLNEAREKKAAEQKAAEAEKPEAAGTSSSGLEDQEPVSVVWEVNGRTESHRVLVYADGSPPESGLCIKVDRFGAAKVLGSGEDGE